MYNNKWITIIIIKEKLSINFSGLISIDLSTMQVGCTSVHGILTWTVASDWTYYVLIGIF